MLPTVYDDVPPQAWPLAERQILAHLDRLRKQGAARASPTRPAAIPADPSAPRGGRAAGRRAGRRRQHGRREDEHRRVPGAHLEERRGEQSRQRRRQGEPEGDAHARAGPPRAQHQPPDVRRRGPRAPSGRRSPASAAPPRRPSPRRGRGRRGRGRPPPKRPKSAPARVKGSATRRRAPASWRGPTGTSGSTATAARRTAAASSGGRSRRPDRDGSSPRAALLPGEVHRRLRRIAVEPAERRGPGRRRRWCARGGPRRRCEAVCPSGLSPGKKRSAKLRLTTATGGASVAVRGGEEPPRQQPEAEDLEVAGARRPTSGRRRARLGVRRSLLTVSG